MQIAHRTITCNSNNNKLSLVTIQMLMWLEVDRTQQIFRIILITITFRRVALKEAVAVVLITEEPKVKVNITQL